MQYLTKSSQLRGIHLKPALEGITYSDNWDINQMTPLKRTHKLH